MSVQDVWARMTQSSKLSSRLREEARIAANEEVVRLRQKLAEADAALARASDLLAIQRRAMAVMKVAMDRAALDAIAVEARP